MSIKREEREQLSGLINAKIDDIKQLMEFVPMSLDKEVCEYHLEQFVVYANIVIDNLR